MVPVQPRQKFVAEKETDPEATIIMRLFHISSSDEHGRSMHTGDLQLRYENMYDTMLCESGACRFLALFSANTNRKGYGSQHTHRRPALRASSEHKKSHRCGREAEPMQALVHSTWLFGPGGHVSTHCVGYIANDRMA